MRFFENPANPVRSLTVAARQRIAARQNTAARQRIAARQDTASRQDVAARQRAATGRERTCVTCVVIAVALLAGCSRGPQRTMEVVAIPAATIPLEPGDAAWRNAPEYAAKLLLQDLVEPRLMKASTQEVLVRSLTSGSEIAFRMQWADPTVDDLPGPSRFLDSCAVQVPKVIDPNLPDPQMGQPGKPVQITFWRADWQASVNGRADDIHSLYPNASIDHYPFQAKSLEPGSAAQKEMATRYAPAEAVGNRRVGPRATPVEDLVSEGPGTLAPAGQTISKGKGIHDAQGWTVVIVRPLPAGFGPKSRTQVAFAVWEGSHLESGARKMRTGWTPLAAREAK